MLYETIRRDDFQCNPAFQVKPMSQPFKTVLRCCVAIKIVVLNYTPRGRPSCLRATRGGRKSVF